MTMSIYDPTRGNPEESNDNKTLSKSIVSVMHVRNMSPANVTERMESGRNRATLYRVLSGATQDPKLSTFLDICQALEVSPTDVLQLAGLLEYRPRETDLLEIRLRQIFRRVQNLPDPVKRLAVSQIGMIADSLEDYAEEREDSAASNHG